MTPRLPANTLWSVQFLQAKPAKPAKPEEPAAPAPSGEPRPADPMPLSLTDAFKALENALLVIRDRGRDDVEIHGLEVILGSFGKPHTMLMRLRMHNSTRLRLTRYDPRFRPVERTRP